MIEIRELTPGEVPTDAEVIPGSLVMGVVEDGEVIALIAAFTNVYLHPLWVSPSHRKKSMGFLRTLWEKMRARLLEADVKSVMGYAHPTQPAMAGILRRLGKEVVNRRQFFIPLGGKL